MEAPEKETSRAGPENLALCGFLHRAPCSQGKRSLADLASDSQRDKFSGKLGLPRTSTAPQLCQNSLGLHGCEWKRELGLADLRSLPLAVLV